MTRTHESPSDLPSSAVLLADLSRLYKVQPATALLRAVEIREVLKVGLGDGIGLDLGCGDGALTGLILRYLDTKPELIGLDYDPGEIAVAERRGIYAGTHCSRGEAMPLDDGSIDFVFSNSVLEHIPALEETIGESARVLKPSGRFIATVPAPGFRELLRAKGHVGAAREDYLDRMDKRLAHLNYLDEDGWRALLGRHGIRLTAATPYLNRAQVQRWERLSAMTGGVLQRLGASNAMLYRLQRLTRSDNKTAGGALSEHRAPSTWNQAWARIVAGPVLNTPAKPGDPFGCLLVQGVKS